MPYDDPFDLQRQHGVSTYVPPLGAMPQQNLLDPSVLNLVSMQTRTPPSQFVPSTFSSPGSQLTPDALMAAHTRSLFRDPLESYWRLFTYPGEVLQGGKPVTTADMTPWAVNVADKLASAQVRAGLPGRKGLSPRPSKKEAKSVLQGGPKNVLYAQPRQEPTLEAILRGDFL